MISKSDGSSAVGDELFSMFLGIKSIDRKKRGYFENTQVVSLRTLNVGCF